MKKSINQLHFKYIIGIMGAIILGLLTLYLFDVPVLMEYITFASTITSITLALLVIIFTYVTNYTLSKSVADLDKSVSNISHDSASINDNVTKIIGQVSLLPDKISSIEEKIDKVQGAPPVSSKISDTKKTKSRSLQESSGIIIARASEWGLMSLYLGKKVNEFDKEFNIEDVVSLTDDPNVDYSYGYLVACHSAGLINLTGNKESFKVTMFDEELAKQVESKINSLIESVDNDTDRSAYFEQIKKVVDNYVS